MPLFLPPAIFSKHNNSQNQLQMKRHKYYEGIAPEIAERLKNADKPQTKPGNVFDRDRKDRKIPSIFLNFKSPAVPTEARQEALTLMRERHLEKQYEEIKQVDTHLFFEGSKRDVSGFLGVWKEGHMVKMRVVGRVGDSCG